MQIGTRFHPKWLPRHASAFRQKANRRTTLVNGTSDSAHSADGFRLPDEPTQASILTAADVFLGQFVEKPADSAAVKAAKTALIAKFIARELPADFVQDLQDDRDAILDDKTAQEGLRTGGVESTSAVGRLIREGN